MKKVKEPSSEFEEEEESTAKDTGSSGGEPELEEEAELATPPLEKRKRMDTQALDKKPTSAFKTLCALKRPMKTLRKGESFQKKPRGK